MHQSSFEKMKNFLMAFSLEHPYKILDVGSLCFPGDKNHRELISNNWIYAGVDLVAGPNVDIVLSNQYSYPFEDEYFDIIISGQCMEHVSEIWTWMKELYRLLKPSGSICIIAPSMGKIHTNIDCWRILPDGMAGLMYWAGFKEIKISHDLESKWGDCMGVATK
jgi:SAM-dependent methyltransferase